MKDFVSVVKPKEILSLKEKYAVVNAAAAVETSGPSCGFDWKPRIKFLTQVVLDEEDHSVHITNWESHPKLQCVVAIGYKGNRLRVGCTICDIASWENESEDNLFGVCMACAAICYYIGCQLDGIRNIPFQKEDQTVVPLGLTCDCLPPKCKFYKRVPNFK